MSDHSPLQHVTVSLGTNVLAVDPIDDLTAPQAYPHGILKRTSIGPGSVDRTARFVAIKAGDVFVGARYVHPSTFDNAAFGVRIVVL